MSDTDEKLQDLANRINLGPHQTVVTATDEQGREGRWVVHRPTLREEIRVGVDYSRLKTAAGAAGPVDIDPVRDDMAFMVATLGVVVELRPEWFPQDVGETRDVNLVCELFEKYAAWKDSFRRPMPGAPTDDRGAAQPA